MMTTPLLHISHASKSYNGMPALSEVTISLQAGEVHALMGENGAGKSTLIKLLAGVLRPDSMTVTVNGQAVSIHDVASSAAVGLRFVHQELNSVPYLSVAENIFLGQAYPTRAGVMIDWSKLNQAAQVVLQQLNITHIAPTHKVTRLSIGDQMLVSIARAFAGAGGQIYIMDEPTAALSGQETDRLFAVIRRLTQQGCAVLYVSHRMDEIFRIAQRVTVLRDGHVVTSEPIDAVTADDLIQAMTGRDLQHLYPPRNTGFQEKIRLQAINLGSDSVHGVTFALRAGEILGVAGLSGSGRSELLRLLMGIERPRQGQLLLNGKPLTRWSPRQAWQRGIAYVPEERRSQGIILTHSVANNITLPHLDYLGIASTFVHHQREQRTSRTIGETVQLRASGPRQLAYQLSGGNQQKVVFAKALARPPQVLLLDEPTRGIDVGAKYDIYRLIRQISTQGTGIIMVSSDLPELLGLSDRILIMQRGALAENVSAQGLTEAQLLSLSYGEIARERSAL